MHDTLVTLKNGTQYRGFIWKVRPAEGYFTLGGVSGQDDPIRIELNDVMTAVTLNERICYGKTGDCDELAQWRKYMRDGRVYGWDGLTPATPLQLWEET